MVQAQAERLLFDVFPCRLSLRFLFEGLHDDAFSRFQLQPDFQASVFHAGLCQALFSVHRIEEHSRRLAYVERYPSVYILALQAGDEVMVSGRVRAADELEAVACLHFFGRGSGRFQHLMIVGPDNDASLSDGIVLCLVEGSGFGKFSQDRSKGFPVLFQLAVSGHVLGILVYKHDRCSLARQAHKLFECSCRHKAGGGHDQCLVMGSSACHQFRILAPGGLYKGIRDVIHVESAGYNRLDGLDELGRISVHLMDVEHHHASGQFVPYIINGQVNQEIVVRLPHLEERLASGDVLEESRSIPPYRVCGRHIDAGIETPSGPCGFLGRIRCAVEEHVVHSRNKHQVHVGLALRQGRAEVVGEPRKCFRGNVRLSRYVRRR